MLSSLLMQAEREGKFIKDKKDQALAPSFIENDPYCETKNYRTMTQEEIWEIIDAFGDAAKGPERQTSMPLSFTGLTPFC